MELPFKIAFASSTGVLISAVGITACCLVSDGVKASRISANASESSSQIQTILKQNICSALTSGEMETLNNARKEGPEAFRYALGMIHYDRRGLWEGKLQQAQQELASAPDFLKADKAKNLKEAKETLQAFSEAYSEIMRFDKKKKQ